MFKMKFKVIV